MPDTDVSAPAGFLVDTSNPEVAVTAEVMPAEPVALPPLTPAETIKAAWPQIVNAWLASSIANSPVARSTEALNHLVSALPALRQALMEIV
jgi:hypothetical protein